MGYVDCHSHLSFLDIEEVAKVIQKGQAKGLSHWVMGGYDFKDWNQQKELSKKFKGTVFTAVGLHPWKILKLNDEEVYKELEKLPEAIADADFIGETGIDFFIANGKERFDIQREVFLKHIQLAGKKPMVFHVVKAHSKVLEILENHEPKAYVHGFSASYELAQQYIDRGVSLSFGRGILSKNYMKAREAVKKIPSDFLLLESDSPEDKKDHSDPIETFLKVAEEVASIRKIKVEELLTLVKENMESFGIK